MARIVKTTFRIETVESGVPPQTFAPPVNQFTQALAKVLDAEYTVTTADAAIDFTASIPAANQGFLVLMNLDPTNYVSFGREVTGAISENARIKALDPPALIPLVPSVTYRWQANTASVKVRAILYAR